MTSDTLYNQKNNSTLTQLKNSFSQQLCHYYTESELRILFYILVDHFFQIKKIDVLTHPDTEVPLPPQWAEAISRLKAHEPIEYITGKASFMNRDFLVNKHTLIPRPETEELLKHAIADAKTYIQTKRSNIRILDVGTGSGCIGVSLALALPTAEVVGIDISSQALRCAEENAKQLHVTNYRTTEIDVLSEGSFDSVGTFDIIVSNPPYIPMSKRPTIDTNVKEYEPAHALFVSDQKPLCFYKAIARQCVRGTLHSGGCVWVEVYQDYAKEVGEVMIEAGMEEIKIWKDFRDKERFVRATHPY